MTRSILLLAAVAAPHAVLSQNLRPSASRLEQIAEAILEKQTQEGPYSADLLGPLTNLSLLYQERGDHALAVAVIEQALQVVRANSGLRSLEQAPLLRRRILNEEARGNFSAAWDLEKELIELANRHPEDLRTVGILREIGDKRMDVLERYFGGAYPPQIILGCFYKPPEYRDGNCHSGSKSAAIRELLADAQRHYADAIKVLLRNELYSSPELREIEMKLVLGGYRHGGAYVRSSLRRLLSYDVVNGESLLTRIDALLRVADWDFLTGDRAPALDTYVSAHLLLEQKGVPKASIDEFFAPPIPVALPTFLPNPLVSDETAATGYIDVSFELTKYGRGRQIEILDTANATDDDEEKLVRTIARSQFRPRITDGELVAGTPVVLRYYLRN